MFTLVLIVAALAVAAVGALPENPTIMFNENQGIIGARLRSAGLATSTVRDYAAFWGVPFADAPVGKLRFKPPQPKDLPEGVFSAADVSAAVGCIQQSRAPLRISGQEDCLTLQIFTPNYDYPTLPVIVNIHGGAFMFGRPISNGLQYIMDHDVVFVTITYRLGILGFMSFEDDELRGNIGMLDQVEALKWVQRNIHHFGGNNESVTLVSNSAGSVSNIWHTMSPLSKGADPFERQRQFQGGVVIHKLPSPALFACFRLTNSMDKIMGFAGPLLFLVAAQNGFIYRDKEGNENKRC